MSAFAPRGSLAPHGKHSLGIPRTKDDARTALAWHLYYTDVHELERQGVKKSVTSSLQAEDIGRPQVSRFAELARMARPGIQSALAVLLGADFENQAATCAETCYYDLHTFRCMLIQAGCDLQDSDTFLVEMLFAAATTSHGRLQCKLLKESHTLLLKSDFEAMLDEDVRWRGAHGGRSRAPEATPDRYTSKRRPLSSSSCHSERRWPEWSLARRPITPSSRSPRPATR